MTNTTLGTCLILSVAIPLLLELIGTDLTDEFYAVFGLILITLAIWGGLRLRSLEDKKKKD